MIFEVEVNARFYNSCKNKGVEIIDYLSWEQKTNEGNK